MATKKKAAPKKRTVNKSAEIRGYLAQHTNAGPTEVVDALGKRGIKVTPSFVSNVKHKVQRGTAGKRKVSRRGNNGQLTAERLLQLKDFAKEIGGLDVVRCGLTVLEKLQK